MNREDIIRMAREVGGADITVNGFTTWVGTQSTEFLERFAALVAAAEWAGWAKYLDDCGEHQQANYIRSRGEEKP